MESPPQSKSKGGRLEDQMNQDNLQMLQKIFEVMQ